MAQDHRKRGLRWRFESAECSARPASSLRMRCTYYVPLSGDLSDSGGLERFDFGQIIDIDASRAGSTPAASKFHSSASRPRSWQATPKRTRRIALSERSESKGSPAADQRCHRRQDVVRLHPRCADNSLCIGETNNVDRRVIRHHEGSSFTAPKRTPRSQ